jgi:anti-anti-sigma regulatory factor
MAPIHLDLWSEGGRHVLRLLGTFDGNAARDLLSQVRREAERDIVIDLSSVRGFDEVGVAALARLVESSADQRIVLRGLTTHQRRILRYLGARLGAGLPEVTAGGEP